MMFRMTQKLFLGHFEDVKTIFGVFEAQKVNLGPTCALRDPVASSSYSCIGHTRQKYQKYQKTCIFAVEKSS